MPIKLFQDGDILTHTDVNTYFMDQALVVFDTEEQRDQAFGGALEPALSEGRICYLKSDDKIYIYTASGWTPQLALIEDGVVTTSKLDGTGGSQAVTTAKIRDLNVTTAKIADLNVTTGKIADAAVTAAKIASAVAGSGLSGGAGTALAVNVDDSTVEINTDALRVKDAGITSAKLSSSLSLTGSTSIQQVLEKATVSGSALSATTDLDALSGAVYYNTASTTSNITLNLRGDGSTTLASLVPVGKAFSCVFMITSGSTSGKILTVTAGSSTVALKWFGGNVSPAGSSGGSVDVYTITAVKTSDTGNGTFTIFISQSKFA